MDHSATPVNAWEEAYLDIETTGLSYHESEVTVVGISRGDLREREVLQLVRGHAGDGRAIKRLTPDNLRQALDGVRVLHTYNGKSFDLPFILYRLKVDVVKLVAGNHRDLMFDCWARNWKGGFKAVERQLCIPRDDEGVNGYMAVQLWWAFHDNGDLDALERLLAYNREDVYNLKVLRQKIDSVPPLREVSEHPWPSRPGPGAPWRPGIR
jgi:uncharacterized protein YprB with RNaseH-like and TPR domain